MGNRISNDHLFGGDEEMCSSAAGHLQNHKRETMFEDNLQRDGLENV
jgi:hypothetical protein